MICVAWHKELDQSGKMDSIERVQSNLVKLLKNEGAALIGFGDMSGVDHCEFPVGISVAVPLPVSTICDLMEAPTVEYSMLYDSLNNDLNRIVKAGERFIRKQGFRAYARCTDVVVVDACPGNALKGTSWAPGMSREDMIDVDACFKTQLRVMEAATGISTDLCGKCFAVCAWTRKYISQAMHD